MPIQNILSLAGNYIFFKNRLFCDLKKIKKNTSGYARVMKIYMSIDLTKTFL